MKIAPLFCLLVFAFCSCSDTQVEKRVYTEKDIEGYWGTYATFHPSSLAESIANDNDTVHNPLLRFYNDVIGFPDSSYYVSGDSIFIREVDFDWNCKFTHVYKLIYRIRFASKERLDLCELSTGQFITYHSFSTLQDHGMDLRSIEIAPTEGEGLIWSRDSVISTFHPWHGCHLSSCSLHYSTLCESNRSESFERVNQFYRCSIVSDILLELEISDDGIPPRTSGFPVKMSTDQIEISFNIGNHCKDPCIRAIYQELRAINLYRAMHAEVRSL